MTFLPWFSLTTRLAGLVRRRFRLLIVSLWLIILVTLYVLLATTDLDTRSIALQTFTLLTSHWWGILLFLGAYTVRPLLFLPVSVFAVVGGIFFGFWVGLVVVYFGVIISAVISYTIGRWLGGAFTYTATIPDKPSLVRRRPFEVVLGLHTTMLPFDLINYAIGASRLPFTPFVAGTMLGMLPGSISLTLLGAGLDIATLLEDGFSVSVFDWRYLTLAGTTLTLSLLGSYLYRRRQWQQK